MKVKIKGLVFVGFAAAILSANAMAADENVVTSKSFTEATYQKKANANYQVSKSDGTWQALGTTLDSNAAGYQPDNAVTAQTIKAYVDGAAAGSNFVENEINAAHTTIAPSGQAVASGLANKQNLDTGSDYVVSKNGAWESMTSAVTPGNTNTITVTSGTNGAAVVSAVTSAINSGATGLAVAGDVYNAIAAVDNDAANTYQPKTVAKIQVATLDSQDNPTWAGMGDAVNTGIYTTKSVDSQTGVITIEANGTTDTSLSSATEVNKLPTAATVRTYVDNALASGGTNQHGYQEASTADYQVAGQNGTWVQISSAVDNTDGHVTVASGANGKVVLGINATDTGTNVGANDSGLTTGKAVYEYVQSVTGGTVIPAKGNICATHPCALVDDANGTHWRTMATANYNGGECGDATGNCGAANPVDTGNVQP